MLYEIQFQVSIYQSVVCTVTTYEGKNFIDSSKIKPEDFSDIGISLVIAERVKSLQKFKNQTCFVSKYISLQ